MTNKKTKPVKKVVKKKIVKKPVKKMTAADKMTAAEKRVAIAKDTIKWLGTKAIKMKPGTYFQFPRKAIKVQNSNRKLNVELKTVKKPCQVCALGGMFYSMVRRFDKVPVSICYSTEYEMNTQYAEGVGHADIYTELANYFPSHQLSLIESAFEKRDLVEMEDYDGICKEFDATFGTELDNVVDRAIAFARKENAVERLRAIMNNIIENNGAFKP
jgi:hypothetical protein